jgi:hypothetical protein
MKNRFISDKVIRIDLSDGDWVEVKEQMSFEQFKEIFGKADANDAMSNIGLALPLLKIVLTAWSFEQDGEKIECTPENIERLSMSSIVEIATPVLPIYVPEKKSSKS